MFKRLTIKFLLISVIATMFLSVVEFPYKSVQAQSFEQRVPTFGLFCNDPDVIKEGAVKFDMTNMESIMQGLAKIQATYKLNNVNRIVKLSIPFISSALNVPNFDIKVKDKKIQGKICYGRKYFNAENLTELQDVIENINPPELDESIYGTLYTIMPDTDTATVNLSFAEGKTKAVLYDQSDSYTMNNTNNSLIWTFSNITIGAKYRFFIEGDTSDYTFNCNCNFEVKRLNCKAIIDLLYEEYNIGISIEYFYSMFNDILANKYSMAIDEMFFTSIAVNRFNTFEFSIKLESDTVITYELPITVQRNFAFEPTIYMVEHKNIKKYPINYIVLLNEYLPFIIESNTKLNPNNLVYSALSDNDFYFVCCQSEKPTNLLAPTNTDNTKIIIACSITVSICVIILIILIIVRHRISVR